MNLIHEQQSIWQIPGFLSQKECDDLIIFSESRGYEEAEVSLPSGSRMMKRIRNNYRVIYEDQNLAKKIWDKLQAHLPAEIDGRVSAGLNERFRFYRYELNERFKRHIDGSFKRNENEASKITLMIYLNEDFVGGETAFDELVVQPTTGSALCFMHRLKHEGCPVQEGTKYVLRTDVMYREK